MHVYPSVFPSVCSGFSTYNFISTCQFKICFVIYLWASLGSGTYHSDLSRWSFVPLFDNKCYIPGTSFVRLTLWPQLLSNEPRILLHVNIDIEDVHIPKTLIFIHIWENYRLLNLVIFEKKYSTYSLLGTSFVRLSPPTIFKWKPSWFIECWYGYWRCTYCRMRIFSANIF
jgi:hypothetical protein